LTIYDNIFMSNTRRIKICGDYLRKIGELLSKFFDEETAQKAERYNGLFSSWTGIAGENIAAHSRIIELEKSVLQIEADHPGWIQILQTRQQYILAALRRKYPELDIHGLSFRLSRNPAPPNPGDETRRQRRSGVTPGEAVYAGESRTPAEGAASTDNVSAAGNSLEDLYGRIQDPALKESLKRIEQELGARKSGARRKI
jgi:hypothetical protein